MIDGDGRAHGAKTQVLHHLLHSFVVYYVNKSKGARCAHGTTVCFFLQVRGEQQAIHDRVLR